MAFLPLTAPSKAFDPKTFDPTTAINAPIGAASPLWLAFAGAASAGVAYWWMTRWMRPINLEAVLFAAPAAPEAPVVVEPVVEAVVELVAETPVLVEAAIEAPVEAAAKIAEPVVETAAEIAEPLVEAAEPVVEAVAEPVAKATPAAAKAPVARRKATPKKSS